MNRIIVLALFVMLIGVVAIIGGFILSNQLPSAKGFGIYLSENNQLVISDKDIIFYNWTSHQIRLNVDGMDRTYLSSAHLCSLFHVHIGYNILENRTLVLSRLNF